MRYTIEGFSQAYAMTLKKEVEVNGKIVVRKIDCTDLVILRWFVDFYPNMKKVECDGRQYAWLTHKKLLEDLPLIDISKRAFIERMQKLVDFKILTYRFIKEGGSFSLYGFGENYKYLVDDFAAEKPVEKPENDSEQTDTVCDQTDTGYTVESIGGIRSNVYGVCDQTHTKDTSIIDNTIIDKSIIEGEKPKRKRFVPPTHEEVKAYCLERKNNVDPEKFINYYTSNGWQVGKNKMKDWKAAVRTWERNGYDNKQTFGQNGIAVKHSKNELEDLF